MYVFENHTIQNNVIKENQKRGCRNSAKYNVLVFDQAAKFLLVSFCK
jgi:hypothetical protein